jgi:CRP/FNR family transcriptional regulator
MKFAARDGSRARTIAGASSTATRRIEAEDGPHPLSDNDGDPRGSSAGSPGGSARLRAGDLVGGGSRDGGRPRQPRPTTTTFQKGEVIFAPGSGFGLVYIVRAGCVRLFKILPDGRSINLALLGPNTIFTQEDGFDGIASGTTAAAIVDSTAALIAESPELAGAVVAGMTRRLTELQMLVEHLLVRDTSVRLATTLLSLASRFGRPSADGTVTITLPLTHQNLANMIGSNRVTVTRKLQELHEEGVVRATGRNALAVNLDRLRAHAARRPAVTADQEREEATAGERRDD